MINEIKSSSKSLGDKMLELLDEDLIRMESRKPSEKMLKFLSSCPIEMVEQVFNGLNTLNFSKWCGNYLNRVAVVLVFVAAVLQGGCSTKSLTDPIVGPTHVTSNFYRQDNVFPSSLRRVAVLPVSYNEQIGSGAAARDVLEPIYHSELTKAARFESVFVKPIQLQQWTGQDRLDDFDELPAGFLKLVSERTGCDGVIFARISHYQAYPPVVVGWRMRLVSNDAGTVWSADELFDSSEQAVSNSARLYDRSHTRNNPVLEDSRSILLSPSKFGQYTLSSVLSTLPTR